MKCDKRELGKGRRSTLQKYYSQQRTTEKCVQADTWAELVGCPGWCLLKSHRDKVASRNMKVVETLEVTEQWIAWANLFVSKRMNSRAEYKRYRRVHGRECWWIKDGITIMMTILKSKKCWSFSVVFIHKHLERIENEEVLRMRGTVHECEAHTTSCQNTNRSL